MGDTPKDVLALLTQLMPGFLTAWVVYGLTTYTKPSQFERVVQALIYSFIVNAIVSAAEKVAFAIGRTHPLGVWDKSVDLIVSALVALTLGLVLSYFMRADGFFSLARKLKLTSRTPYPSEWYGAFARKPCFVVLHLQGGRRISGFPVEWPTEPKAGHFRLTVAAWLTDDNEEVPLDADESILIEAEKVEIVEFLKDPTELSNASEAAESPAASA